MRTSIAGLGLLALLVPALAAAQDAPPPVAPATAPPPAATPETAPPPADPMATSPAPVYAAPPPMVVSQTEGAPSPMGPSVWGIFPWSGYGFGARFMLPVGIPSLIRHHRIKDAWAVEFGADYIHWNFGFGTSDYGWSMVVPVGALMWNVWLTPDFAVYPKAELGFGIGWYTGWEGDTSVLTSHGGLWASGAAGLLYKLGGNITLRAEAGNTGAKGGVGFLF